MMKTDSQIQGDVMAQLKWEPFLNPSEIGVAVKDGIVTLSGQVDSYLKKVAAEIDTTLQEHVESLQTQNLKEISALEKKLLRAEKRKFENQENQLRKIFSALFPGKNLQERTENFMTFYSKWGSDFFEILYNASLTLEQEFCIIEVWHHKN